MSITAKCWPGSFLIFFLAYCAAASSGSQNEISERGAWPYCDDCGIDFSNVRSPLLEYAREMGAEAAYSYVESYLSSYACPGPPGSNVAMATRWVRGEALKWRTERLADEIRCLSLQSVGEQASAEEDGFTELSFDESIILLSYLSFDFPLAEGKFRDELIYDYCLQAQPPGPDDRAGRTRAAPPVAFGHPDRRLLYAPNAEMLTPCKGGTNPVFDAAEGVEVYLPIRPFQIRRATSPRGANQSQDPEAAVATWVSSRGNVLGTGDKIDVTGLLRGGAQRVTTVFGNQVKIDDPEDADVAAIVASGFSSRTRAVVGLGPWGELDFPHGRVCIKDMQQPHCDLAIRWDTDEASSPVLRHVVSGETLGEGRTGSVSLQLDGAAAVQRVELIDSTARILDRKTAKVVESVGDISATLTDCSASSTTASSDAETCTVELVWSTEYAPSATLWKIGMEPQAAQLLLGRADQGTTLVDQIQANTSIVYELRQLGTFSSGLLATAKVFGEVAN